MNGFFSKFQQFMMGRNGLDRFCYFLFAVYALLVVVNIFVHSLILYIIELIIAAYIIFRVLSKSIYKRQKENGIYMKAETAVKNFFIRQKNRIRDMKTHSYVKCKSCKAQLRVKRLKGKHTVRCPKCGNTFGVRIR